MTTRRSPTGDCLDVYTRTTATIAIARWGDGIRRTARRERGRARRYPTPNGIDAESLAVETALPMPPIADLERALRAARAADVVVLQQANLVHEIERRDGFVGHYRTVFALSVVTSHGPSGAITIARVSHQLVPDVLRADSTAVTTATRLAAQPSECQATSRSLALPAPVAASILAALWTWSPDAGLESRDVSLRDDARLGGGPLGAPFDGVGEATRVVELGERGAASELGYLRPGFGDVPMQAPANLRLVARVPTRELPAADVEVAAVETLEGGPESRVALLGRDNASGRGLRVLCTLTLARFLAAITDAGDQVAWVPAIGTVGCPALRLELG